MVKSRLGQIFNDNQRGVSNCLKMLSSHRKGLHWHYLHQRYEKRGKVYTFTTTIFIPNPHNTEEKQRHEYEKRKDMGNIILTASKLDDDQN